MKKSSKKAELWYNGDIPAKLFFEILETNKLSLLKKTEGSTKKGQLKRNWANIYDEYFVLKKDVKLALIISTQANIIKMLRQIELTRQAVYVICTVDLDDGQIEILADKIREQGFTFDDLNPLNSSLSVLRDQIPSYETRIELEKDKLENLTKGEISTFEDNCVSYEQWGFKIDENVSLRRYVAYEKAVLSKAKKQKANGKR